MSTIELYVLGALADVGPMHGYQLRRRALQEENWNWMSIPVTAIYGALKRLVAQEYVVEERLERDGGRPPRQVVRITDNGRAHLAQLARETLVRSQLPPDPLDIVLARPGDVVDDLAVALATRLVEVRGELAERLDIMERLRPTLSLAESLAIRHYEGRLRAEINFLVEAVAAVPDVVADEGRRRASSTTQAGLSPPTGEK